MTRIAKNPTGKVGIRTITDLMGRCVVDELTDCWIWRAGRNAEGRPNLWFPALGRPVSLGVAIGTLRTGQAPAKGVIWHCTCETPNCANPWHRVEGNRQSQMLSLGLTRTPLQRMRQAIGRRKNSKISDADVAEIRHSPDVLRVIAQKYGISMTHASRIKRGEIRQPLGAHGSSVFATWRQAA